jgi:prepilin-type N-terminal cleavage/methylation domain-containing protein/prepilin-type processing-associated H-X9-DG protein
MFAPSRRRSGFTLVELLVVIAIIGVLVALILPAVQAARETARKAQCLDRMANIGKAMVNFSSGKGNLPGYVQPVTRADKTVVSMVFGSTLSTSTYESAPGGPGSKEASLISWAGRILPQLDRNDLWDRLIDPTVNDDLVRPIDILICPSDQDATSSSENAALSFVVNSGAWDFDETGGFIGDTVDNGLFQNLSRDKQTSRIDHARDGSASTLMVAENIHKNAAYCWLGVPEDSLAEQTFGMVWVSPEDSQVNLDAGNGIFQVDPTPAGPNDYTIRVQEPLGRESVTDFRNNAPRFARPASSHTGGSFNVVFVDGHGDAIEPAIDYVVYQQLLSANGKKSVDPTTDPTDPPGKAIQAYRTAPPLSDNSY